MLVLPAGTAGTGRVTADRSFDDPALRLALGKRFVAIESTRGVTKADMRENDARPDVRVDPDSFAVHIDGELVEATPAAELPMAQRYFLF